MTGEPPLKPVTKPWFAFRSRFSFRPKFPTYEISRTVFEENSICGPKADLLHIGGPLVRVLRVNGHFGEIVIGRIEARETDSSGKTGSRAACRLRKD